MKRQHICRKVTHHQLHQFLIRARQQSIPVLELCIDRFINSRYNLWWYENEGCGGLPNDIINVHLVVRQCDAELVEIML